MIHNLSGARHRGCGRTATAIILVSIFVLQPCAGQDTASTRKSGDLTFSVQSQLVQIYFTVTEGKHRVGDLNASGLTLTEDGRDQRIERLETGTAPLQIALLLDTSESMREALPAVQKAATYFVESLLPQDRVTLVTFNSDIRALTQVSADRAPVLAAIRNLRPSGNTRLFDALLFAMRQLSRKEGRKAIVSFSDGEDTARSSSLNVVLNAAALYGLPIYTIGAGDAVERDGLRQILKQLSDVNCAGSYFVQDPLRLRTTFAEIADELRTAYVVSYYTAVPLDGRWHETRINLADPRYRVAARKGFFARPEMSPTLLSEPKAPTQLARADFERPGPPVTDPQAMVAFRELQSAPLPPMRDVDRTMLQPSDPGLPVRENKSKRPYFKVESRFVEVPVLIESMPGQTLPELQKEDFRVYEDSSLQEIVFFTKASPQQGLPDLRKSALSSGQTGSGSPVLADPREVVLGRAYLVLDNTSSEAAAFLRARQAAAKLMADNHNPLRPISVHLTGESTTDIVPVQNVEQMLQKLNKTGLQTDRDLTSNDGIMTIYEAFLIEQGDRQAQQLAELRYAASLKMQYSNGLGAVDGPIPADPNMIQSGVITASKTLVTQNLNQVNRTLDGLKTVVNAAVSDPGEYPKMVILFSSGFSTGRTSMRGDVSIILDQIAKKAKAHGVRFVTVNAAGLETQELIGIGASGSFLVGNSPLASLLSQHATAWRNDREAPLAQLAQETGGKFVHSTNDLLTGAATAMGGNGQLYYLGFLSSQPIDGRFHGIRVLTSAHARVHARRGFYARPYAEVTASEDQGEDLRTLVSRAQEARKSGDIKTVAESLDKVVRRVADNPDIWYNLASARMALNDPEAAISALQKAFVLAPEDKFIGSALARALVAAGYRQAAAETLESMVQKHPRDIALLVELGRVYEADSRLTDAYQAYRSVLDITLAPPLDVYVLLTRTSAQLGRRTEADLFIRDYLSRGGTETSIGEWRRVRQNP